MRSLRHRRNGLLWLNVALLIALAAVALSPAASGQRSGNVQGDYILIGGNIQGLSPQGVYLIDARNGEIAAFYYDQTSKLLQPIGYRDMAQDMRRAEGGSR